ncbi:manganese-dependent ADP-ribose/CDP-alcohol diphosphatase-like [Antedon mediterranea]|uniref:manganese-dependent ADP-ribose/CDP-alcohol diphosphatase-like n=1 Tax=Antedon mediterranea TaxID=105859 RepID=UPI003AF4713A
MAALFSFGIIADVQYADIDTCYNFNHTRLRYYRNAKPLLRNAVDHWISEQDISFVTQLGDVIDGFNTRKGKRESWRALTEIMDEFDRFSGKLHHLIGNHELYNFSRKEIYESKLFSADEFQSGQDHTIEDPEDERKKFYYHFSPEAGYRFVILDSYDVSMLGWGADSAIMQQATQIVTSVNSNQELNSPLGLEGLETRFVKFNGAIGDRQRNWLRHVLQTAENDEEKVFIFGHIPFHPNKTSDNICLLWDYDQVLEILHQFKCVVATFAGHSHTGSYTHDAKHIHHIVVPAVVEAPPGSDAFGTVAVYDDRIVINGHGSVKSAEFRYQSTP